MSQLQLEEEDRWIIRKKGLKVDNNRRKQADRRLKLPENGPTVTPQSAQDSIQTPPVETPLLLPAETAVNEKIAKPTIPLTNSDNRLASFQYTYPSTIISASNPREAGSTGNKDTIEASPKNLNLDPTRREGISFLSIRNAPIQDLSNGPKGPSMRASKLRNVWFWRSISMIFIQVVSGLLLAYDFIFSYTFQSLNNTTSYYPWAWQEVIYNSGAATVLFSIGFVVSISLLAVSSLFLFGYFIPALNRTMKNVNSTNNSPRPYWARLKGSM